MLALIVFVILYDPKAAQLVTEWLRTWPLKLADVLDAWSAARIAARTAHRSVWRTVRQSQGHRSRTTASVQSLGSQQDLRIGAQGVTLQKGFSQ